MPKYFLSDSIVKKTGKVCVKNGTAHHLLHVLRYKLGQPAIFCDGKGIDIHCIFEEYDNKNKILFFRIENETECFNELPYNVTLYQSVISAGKMEYAIQKSTELGVNKIVPVFTKYSSIKVSGIGEKSERYQKIAESSAEQSMRGYIPEVMPSIKFESINAKEKKELLWLAAYENERTATVSQAINSLAITGNNLSSIGIWIGPEGGFAGEEITRLTELNAVLITLGRRILRAETAGISALVQLQCTMKAETL